MTTVKQSDCLFNYLVCEKSAVYDTCKPKMGGPNAFLQAVVKFMNKRYFVFIALFINQVLSTIHIFVFATMLWLESEEGATTVREGLWSHCNYTGDVTSCQTLDSYLLYRNNGVPGWIHGCRALQSIGLLTGVLCYLLFIWTLLKRKYPSGKLGKVFAGMNFCTFGVILSSIIIYGSSYKQATWMQNPSLSVCFGGGVFLVICYFFQCILIVVAICSDKGNINTRYMTDSPAGDLQNNQGNEEDVIRVATVPNHQINQDNLPSHWQPMEQHQTTLLVKLIQGTSEYRKIENEFRRTLGALNVTIVSIERIQIKDLYQQYQIAKDRMIKALPYFQTQQIEKHLWHGTPATTVESIIRYGFDRSYCGKNGTMYGKGVYFALQTEYSAQQVFSPPDDKGHSRMFLCMVLVGEYTLGDPRMKKPPIKYGHILFDSTVDDTTIPTIFVIYKDAHAYPEYLVTFKL